MSQLYQPPRKPAKFELSRRKFLGTAGALAGSSALGFTPGMAAAATPQRGGTLRMGMRADTTGLDQHRNYFWMVSVPMGATSMGLMDLDPSMNVVPGMAISHEVSADLKTYTFKMREGATYHDGRPVDAASVKWNFERILDKSIGNPVVRAPLEGIDTMEAMDASTLRITLKEASAVFVPSLTYYPVQLMSPASAETADTNPVGCGPYKFVSWNRNDTTVLERFDGWYERDENGNPMPYFDSIIGKPITEDTVRLTALRAGDVDFIENMAFSDMLGFADKYGSEFQTYESAQGATGYIGFNHKKGIFSNDTPEGKMMRQAVAHAFNEDAIHHGVFNGIGKSAAQFYSEASPWHLPSVKRKYEYDPDKARFLIKKAGAEGASIKLLSRDTYLYLQQSADIFQALLTDVGLKVKHEIHPLAVLTELWKNGDYDLDSNVNGYRLDPDIWYGRYIHSKSPTTAQRTGYNNPQADALIEEGARTLDADKRIEIYTEVENMVNEDLPLLYTHFVPLLQAGTNRLQNFRSSNFGPFSTSMGGIRSAYFG
jgi:peptide/nickel transport system substrate-binding protein